LLTGCTDTSVSSTPIPETPSIKIAKTAHTHDTPGDTCFICDETKRDPERLWCKGHKRYEDRCFQCHPELEDKERLFCSEHSLYEDECHLCHPELLQQNRDPAPIDLISTPLTELVTDAERSDRPDGLFCTEHGVSESDCGVCHPDLLIKKAVGEGMKIRFSSPQSAKKAGVRTGLAQQGVVNIGETALGRLSYNMNKLALVSPFAEGVIRTVYVEAGEVVQKGQLLAEINSPAVADAKSALVKALVDEERTRLELKREEYLLESKVSTKQDFESAQASHATSVSEVERSRQQLLNFGLTDEEVKQVENKRSSSSILPLRAPFDGSVVERNAVIGMTVEIGSPLFEIADLATMWLELSVAEGAAVQLQTGSAVMATFEAFPRETFDGELIWVSSHIDESTRMVNARVLLPNPDHRLKSGLFGSALITESKEKACLTVPSDAVQTINGQSIVFAKLEDDLYEARVIQLGPIESGRTAIIQGILQQEEIALTESYILKSELLKGKLGAGCVHD
jgi:membrane fusion protein, heavy metal efflux system